jgi:hypothetical protein
MDGLDLSKDQKRIARQVIETGLFLELAKCIDKIDKIIQKWKQAKSETKETYYELYKTSKISISILHTGMII